MGIGCTHPSASPSLAPSSLVGDWRTSRYNTLSRDIAGGVQTHLDFTLTLIEGHPALAAPPHVTHHESQGVQAISSLFGALLGFTSSTATLSPPVIFDQTWSPAERTLTATHGRPPLAGVPPSDPPTTLIIRFASPRTALVTLENGDLVRARKQTR